MLREASWSRSNFSWGMFRCKRPNVTLAASSGFDQPLMIASASSLILELGARLWQVCRRSRSYRAVGTRMGVLRAEDQNLPPENTGLQRNTLEGFSSILDTVGALAN